MGVTAPHTKVYTHSINGVNYFSDGIPGTKSLLNWYDPTYTDQGSNNNVCIKAQVGYNPYGCRSDLDPPHRFATLWKDSGGNSLQSLSQSSATYHPQIEITLAGIPYFMDSFGTNGCLFQNDVVHVRGCIRFGSGYENFEFGTPPNPMLVGGVDGDLFLSPVSTSISPSGFTTLEGSMPTERGKPFHETTVLRILDTRFVAYSLGVDTINGRYPTEYDPPLTVDQYCTYRPNDVQLSGNPADNLDNGHKGYEYLTCDVKNHHVTIDLGSVKPIKHVVVAGGAEKWINNNNNNPNTWLSPNTVAVYNISYSVDGTTWTRWACNDVRYGDTGQLLSENETRLQFYGSETEYLCNNILTKFDVASSTGSFPNYAFTWKEMKPGWKHQIARAVSFDARYVRVGIWAYTSEGDKDKYSTRPRFTFAVKTGKVTDTGWLKMHLGNTWFLHSIKTRGGSGWIQALAGSASGYVTKYNISISTDDISYTNLGTFDGNVDSENEVEHIIEYNGPFNSYHNNVRAKYVKIDIVEYQGTLPVLRADLVGIYNGVPCPCLDSVLYNPSNAFRTYSGFAYDAKNGVLDDTTNLDRDGYEGWIGQTPTWNGNTYIYSYTPYMIVDITKPTSISGVVVQGAVHHDDGIGPQINMPDRYCSKIMIQVSIDGDEWRNMGEFDANTDGFTHKTITFSPSVFARYVKFTPTASPNTMLPYLRAAVLIANTDKMKQECDSNVLPYNPPTWTTCSADCKRYAAPSGCIKSQHPLYGLPNGPYDGSPESTIFFNTVSSDIECSNNNNCIEKEFVFRNSQIRLRSSLGTSNYVVMHTTGGTKYTETTGQYIGTPVDLGFTDQQSVEAWCDNNECVGYHEYPLGADTYYAFRKSNNVLTSFSDGYDYNKLSDNNLICDYPYENGMDSGIYETYNGLPDLSMNSEECETYALENNFTWGGVTDLKAQIYSTYHTREVKSTMSEDYGGYGPDFLTEGDCKVYAEILGAGFMVADDSLKPDGGTIQSGGYYFGGSDYNFAFGASEQVWIASMTRQRCYYSPSYNLVIWNMFTGTALGGNIIFDKSIISSGSGPWHLIRKGWSSDTHTTQGYYNGTTPVDLNWPDCDTTVPQDSTKKYCPTTGPPTDDWVMTQVPNGRVKLPDIHFARGCIKLDKFYNKTNVMYYNSDESIYADAVGCDHDENSCSQDILYGENINSVDVTQMYQQYVSNQCGGSMSQGTYQCWSTYSYHRYNFDLNVSKNTGLTASTLSDTMEEGGVNIRDIYKERCQPTVQPPSGSLYDGHCYDPSLSPPGFFYANTSFNPQDTFQLVNNNVNVRYGTFDCGSNMTLCETKCKGDPLCEGYSGHVESLISCTLGGNCVDTGSGGFFEDAPHHCGNTCLNEADCKSSCESAGDCNGIIKFQLTYNSPGLPLSSTGTGSSSETYDTRVTKAMCQQFATDFGYNFYDTQTSACFFAGPISMNAVSRGCLYMATTYTSMFGCTRNAGVYWNSNCDNQWGSCSTTTCDNSAQTTSNRKFRCVKFSTMNYGNDHWYYGSAQCSRFDPYGGWYDGAYNKVWTFKSSARRVWEYGPEIGTTSYFKSYTRQLVADTTLQYNTRFADLSVKDCDNFCENRKTGYTAAIRLSDGGCFCSFKDCPADKQLNVRVITSGQPSLSISQQACSDYAQNTPGYTYSGTLSETGNPQGCFTQPGGGTYYNTNTASTEPCGNQYNSNCLDGFRYETKLILHRNYPGSSNRGICIEKGKGTASLPIEFTPGERTSACAALCREKPGCTHFATERTDTTIFSKNVNYFYDNNGNKERLPRVNTTGSRCILFDTCENTRTDATGRFTVYTLTDFYDASQLKRFIKNKPSVCVKNDSLTIDYESNAPIVKSLLKNEYECTDAATNGTCASVSREYCKVIGLLDQNIIDVPSMLIITEGAADNTTTQSWCQSYATNVGKVFEVLGMGFQAFNPIGCFMENGKVYWNPKNISGEDCGVPRPNYEGCVVNNINAKPKGCFIENGIVYFNTYTYATPNCTETSRCVCEGNLINDKYDDCRLKESNPIVVLNREGIDVECQYLNAEKKAICAQCNCFSGVTYGHWSNILCDTCAVGYGKEQCRTICADYDGETDNSMCGGYGKCLYGSEVIGNERVFQLGKCICGQDDVFQERDALEDYIVTYSHAQVNSDRLEIMQLQTTPIFDEGSAKQLCSNTYNDPRFIPMGLYCFGVLYKEISQQYYLDMGQASSKRKVYDRYYTKNVITSTAQTFEITNDEFLQRIDKATEPVECKSAVDILASGKDTCNHFSQSQKSCTKCEPGWSGYNCRNTCQRCLLGGNCDETPSLIKSAICTCPASTSGLWEFNCCPTGFRVSNLVEWQAKSQEEVNLIALTVTYDEESTNELDASFWCKPCPGVVSSDWLDPQAGFKVCGDPSRGECVPADNRNRCECKVNANYNTKWSGIACSCHDALGDQFVSHTEPYGCIVPSAGSARCPSDEANQYVFLPPKYYMLDMKYTANKLRDDFGGAVAFTRTEAFAIPWSDTSPNEASRVNNIIVWAYKDYEKDYYEQPWVGDIAMDMISVRILPSDPTQYGQWNIHMLFDGEGPCDTDVDCAGTLKCFVRTNGEPKSGYDTSFIGMEDNFCYDDNTVASEGKLGCIPILEETESIFYHESVDAMNTETCNVLLGYEIWQCRRLKNVAGIKYLDVNTNEYKDNDIGYFIPWRKDSNNNLVIQRQQYPCPPGTYGSSLQIPSYNMHSCAYCNVGFYQDEEGQTSCKKCVEFQNTQQIGATSASGCANCPAGKYYTGENICTDCPRGKYGPRASPGSPDGIGLCVECADGTYSHSEGLAEVGQIAQSSWGCTPCPKGRYGDSTKAYKLTTLTQYSPCAYCSYTAPSSYAGHGTYRSCKDGYFTGGACLIVPHGSSGHNTHGYYNAYIGQTQYYVCSNPSWHSWCGQSGMAWCPTCIKINYPSQYNNNPVDGNVCTNTNGDTSQACTIPTELVPYYSQCYGAWYGGIRL